MSEEKVTQEQLLDRLHGMLTEAGWPSDAAREVVDLSGHAVDQAIETFQRIVFASGSPLVMMQAVSIGGKLLAERAQFVSIKAKGLADAVVGGGDNLDSMIAAAEAFVAQEQGQ